MLQHKQTAANAEVLGLNRITKQLLRDLCKKDKLYLTPALNDVLYLHYKGFECIENLEEYTDLKCLWLESNAISEIQGLDKQTKLKCLFLHNNLIRKIENLENCAELDTLNLSSNHIRKVENCGSDKLPYLTSLNLSSNYLTDFDALCELEKCKTLSVLDLSNNRIDDILVVKIFAKMPELRVLILQGNPVVSKLPQYRKTIILECRELTYLDSRPVFERDRACAEAWKRGGYMEERKESERWNRKERKKMRDSVNATIRMRNKHRSEDNQLSLCSSSESDTEPAKNKALCMDMDAGLDMTADIWDEVKGDYHIPTTEPSESSKDSSVLTSSSTSSNESSLDVPINEFKNKKRLEIVSVQDDEHDKRELANQVACDAEVSFDSEDGIENNLTNIEKLESVVNNMIKVPITACPESAEAFDSDIDTSGFDMVERMVENSGKSAEEYFKETYGDAAQLEKTPEQMKKELIEEVETTKQLEVTLGKLSADIETRMEELQEEQQKLISGDVEQYTDSEDTASDSSESITLTVNPKSNIFKHRQEQSTMQALEQHLQVTSKSCTQLEARDAKYEEYYKIVYDDEQKSEILMSNKERLNKEEKEDSSIEEITIMQAQTQKTTIIKEDYSFEQHSEHLYCNCFENDEDQTAEINEKVEDLAKTEHRNKALQTYIRQEVELRGLLQQLEEENDRLYEINCLYEAVLENQTGNTSDNTEQSKNICGGILTEIIHNLTLDANAIKNYKIIEAIDVDETTESEHNNTEQIYKSVTDVVGNFNKMMKNIMEKNRAEKQLQEQQYKALQSNSIVYTQEQKVESLKNLLKSPSLQEFNADTDESLNLKLDKLQVKQNKQIKRLVDRVYAQRDRYNDSLELIDNRLMVVKKDSGEIEEIQQPRRYFACVDEDDDSDSEQFVQAKTSLKNEEYWAEDGSELLTAYNSELNFSTAATAESESDSDSNEEYYSLNNDTKLIGKIDNDFLQKLDFQHVQHDLMPAECTEIVKCARSYEELKEFLRERKYEVSLTTEEQVVLDSMLLSPKDESRNLTSAENQLLNKLFERTKQKEKEQNKTQEQESANEMEFWQKEELKDTNEEPYAKLSIVEITDENNITETAPNPIEPLTMNFQTDIITQIHADLPLSPKSAFEEITKINIINQNDSINAVLDSDDDEPMSEQALNQEDVEKTNNMNESLVLNSEMISEAHEESYTKEHAEDLEAKSQDYVDMHEKIITKQAQNLQNNENLLGIEEIETLSMAEEKCEKMEETTIILEGENVDLMNKIVDFETERNEFITIGDHINEMNAQINKNDDRHKNIQEFITGLYNHDGAAGDTIENNQQSCIQLSVHSAKLFEYCCDTATSVRNDDVIEIANLTKDAIGVQGTFAAIIDEPEEECELLVKDCGTQCDEQISKKN